MWSLWSQNYSFGQGAKGLPCYDICTIAALAGVSFSGHGGRLFQIFYLFLDVYYYACLLETYFILLRVYNGDLLI